jgi:N-acetylglucosaminyldiphosphoundecaprenol N-acetyl-beta-D-mannosaminyltransferase
VLGYPLDALTLAQAREWVLGALRDPRPKLVVTLNPEIIVQATDDAGLARALAAADLCVADGVGVAWAASRRGRRLPGRVPGVELAAAVLAGGGGAVSVYLLGARPGVAERAARHIEAHYGCTIAGLHHGYFRRPDEVAEVCAAVRGSGAALLLAGLGDGQERFLFENREALGVPVMMGVGGTLDVWAGEVRRMPAWTSRLGLEWLFRVGLDPNRWRRLPRLLRFVRMVMRAPGDAPG